MGPTCAKGWVPGLNSEQDQKTLQPGADILEARQTLNTKYIYNRSAWGQVLRRKQKQVGQRVSREVAIEQSPNGMQEQVGNDESEQKGPQPSARTPALGGRAGRWEGEPPAAICRTDCGVGGNWETGW